MYIVVEQLQETRLFPRVSSFRVGLRGLLFNTLAATEHNASFSASGGEYLIEPWASFARKELKIEYLSKRLRKEG